MPIITFFQHTSISVVKIVNKIVVQDTDSYLRSGIAKLNTINIITCNIKHM